MKTLKRVYFLFFQWHRSYIFLELNTTLKSLLPDGHLDRRRPWPRRGLRDPRKPISGKTFPFNRFLSSSIQNSVLELLLENSRWAPTSVKLFQNIIHRHFLIPPPAVRGWLVRWHNMQIDWKGKVLDHLPQCLSKSRSGWLLKETRSCFQMNYNGPSCFHKLPQPL